MKPLIDCFEGLLDADFDIKDEDISILNTYNVKWDVLEPMMSPPFERARKEWLAKPGKDLKFPHIQKNKFGTGNFCRYFIDWLAAQPAALVADGVFADSNFNGGICDAFYNWMPDDTKFRISIMKYGSEKFIYFNIMKNRNNSEQVLRISLK